jgi:hypothetical protein
MSHIRYSLKHSFCLFPSFPMIKKGLPLYPLFSDIQYLGRGGLKGRRQKSDKPFWAPISSLPPDLRTYRDTSSDIRWKAYFLALLPQRWTAQNVVSSVILPARQKYAPYSSY